MAQQEFKINAGQINDTSKALSDIKMSDYADKTIGEFMVVVRASIGLTGFNVLDSSIEDELQLKLKEKDKELKELKNKIKELEPK